MPSRPAQNDPQTERKANPSDPRRFIRKSCHSRPNIGKRRDLGLGSFPEIGVAKARERAVEAKDQVSRTVDVPFYPDNLTLKRDGTVIVAGIDT